MRCAINLCNIFGLVSMSLSPLTIVSAAALDVDDGEGQADEWLRIVDWGNLVNALRFCGSAAFIWLELTTVDAMSSIFDVTMIFCIFGAVISSSPSASTFFVEWEAVASCGLPSTESLLFSCEVVIVLRRLLHSAVDSFAVISWSCSDGRVLIISTGVSTRMCWS